MIQYWLVFMLLAPDGEVLKVDKRQVNTHAECVGAETETKNPDNTWFIAKCGMLYEG